MHLNPPVNRSARSSNTLNTLLHPLPWSPSMAATPQTIGSNNNSLGNKNGGYHPGRCLLVLDTLNLLNGGMLPRRNNNMAVNLILATRMTTILPKDPPIRVIIIRLAAVAAAGAAAGDIEISVLVKAEDRSPLQEARHQAKDLFPLLINIISNLTLRGGPTRRQVGRQWTTRRITRICGSRYSRIRIKGREGIMRIGGSTGRWVKREVSIDWMFERTLSSSFAPQIRCIAH